MIQAVVSSDQLFSGQAGDLTVRLTNAGMGKCTNIIFKLALPDQVLILRGNDRIEIPQLGSGESVTQHLRVRPEAAGTWIATSPNFSYRDKFGMPQRVSDFLTEITVVPEIPVAPEPEPSHSVQLTTRHLVRGDWEILRGCVANTGTPPLNDVGVSIAGPVTTDQPAGRLELGTIPPGTEKEFSFYVRAKQPGGHVPVHVTTTFSTESGSRRRHDVTIPVTVRESPKSSGNVVRILYLSANPIEKQMLALDNEQRGIRETLRLGNSRDGLKLHTRVGVRIKDLTQALLDIKPRIVHFSGHGAPDGRLYLVTEHGHSSLVPVDGLAALFKEVSDTVECVIVNACDTLELAQALVQHIDYVIGMRQQIGDKAAIDFSTGFYQALAAGRPVEEAFRLGKVQIQLQPHGGHEFGTPLLLKKS